MVLPLEESGNEDFVGIASRTRKGFGIIRKELDEMKRSLDLMKNYLGQQKRDYGFYKKDVDSRNEEFKRESEEFSSKLVKIKVLLSEFNMLRREMVIGRDLGKIEARIKVSCKGEVSSCKKKNKNLEEKLEVALDRIAALEKGTVLKKRKVFWRKKERKKPAESEILEEDSKEDGLYSDSEVASIDELRDGDVKKLGEKRVWTAEELKAEVSGDGEKKISKAKRARKKVARKRK
ncbi:hypothetical protein HN604_03060 [archaeon]|jgi:hypothetical protein|nr:hypothetical protein [archaeon]MBT6183024.1 hypothetical protein [archaeon]MBT6606508.1 hypothetical protein [archaeon]MBT7251327.1 hypothetical protein [archaeon]MBT7661038.1 hypothetical protein [archaeon]